MSQFCCWIAETSSLIQLNFLPSQKILERDSSLSYLDRWFEVPNMLTWLGLQMNASLLYHSLTWSFCTFESKWVMQQIPHSVFLNKLQLQPRILIDICKGMLRLIRLCFDSREQNLLLNWLLVFMHCWVIAQWLWASDSASERASSCVMFVMYVLTGSLFLLPP